MKPRRHCRRDPHAPVALEYVPATQAVHDDDRVPPASRYRVEALSFRQTRILQGQAVHPSSRHSSYILPALLFRVLPCCTRFLIPSKLVLGILGLPLSRRNLLACLCSLSSLLPHTSSDPPFQRFQLTATTFPAPPSKHTPARSGRPYDPHPPSSSMSLPRRPCQCTPTPTRPLPAGAEQRHHNQPG